MGGANDVLAMEIIIVLFAWCLVSALFAELFPLLLEGAGYLLAYLLYAVWIALKTVVTLGIRALLWLAPRLWAGIKLATYFSFLLVQEWRRGPAAEDSESSNEEEPGGDETQDIQDPREREVAAYRTALAALGLPEPFSKQDLIKAFRAAIKKAHSDLGGSDDAARRIIAARDLLMREHGWT